MKTAFQLSMCLLSLPMIAVLGCATWNCALSGLWDWVMAIAIVELMVISVPALGIAASLYGHGDY